MQDLIIYFGVGIASAGTVVGLIAFCLHRKKKKKVAFYIESFNNYFRKNRDIRLTMLSMLKKYKKRSKRETVTHVKVILLLLYNLMNKLNN